MAEKTKLIVNSSKRIKKMAKSEALWDNALYMYLYFPF